jgi:AcrR family transcriptional regulator
MSTEETRSRERARRTQSQRRAATREALVQAARATFTERGFLAATTEEIAAAAGVSKGAVYHHFRNKDDLFRAVVARLETELDEAVRVAASAGGDALGIFMAGCRACLDFFLRPDYRRVVLVEGPAVLGRAEWHEMDTALGLQTMEVGVQFLMDEGVVAPGPVRPLAVLLFGALNEAGMTLARAPQPEAMRDQLLVAIGRLVGGLAP